ncbi:MAG: EAL domain-containing protein [Methylococcaceae bacterium]|nr:MAG: EAL domain-containing protein [Methylococcaceae bacterium]
MLTEVMTERFPPRIIIANRGWLLVIALLLILGLGLSFFYYRQAKAWEEEAWRRNVAELVFQRADMLLLSLSRIEESLKAIAALYNTRANTVTRREFGVFAQGILERLPVDHLQWQPKVEHAERSLFETQARRDGLADFAFAQWDNQGRKVAAAERDVYFPVFYDVSVSPDKSMLGMDLSQDPIRLAHQWLAVSSGATTVSPVYETSARRHRTQPTPTATRDQKMVMSLPIFTQAHLLNQEQRRQHLQGFVAAVLDIHDLLKPVVQGVTDHGIDILIYDASPDADQAPFYYRLSLQSDLADSADLQGYQAGHLDVAKTLELGGRTWRLVFHPTAIYLNGMRSWLPEQALLAGVLLTLVFVAHVYSAQRRRAEIEGMIVRLQESEDRFNLFMDNSPGLAFVKDAEGRLVYINKTFAKGFGFKKPAQWYGKTDEDLWPKDVAESFRNNDLAVLAGEKAQVMEERAVRKGQQETWLSVKFPFRDRHGQRFLGSIAMNVSDRKQVEEQLRLAARVFEHASEGIVITDSGNNIITINPAFEHITGYSAGEAVGRNPNFLTSGRHPTIFYQRLWQVLMETGSWQGEIWNRRKNGEVYAEWLSLSVVRDDAGLVSHYIGIFSDITERKAAEDRIQFLAHYDELTQLPNRTLTRDRLQQALLTAARNNEFVSILFLDLDRFKLINDSLGHHVGDVLLQQVGQRIRSCLREMDTVGRLGGDEFLVVLPDTDVDGAAHVAKKILEQLSLEFHIEEHRLNNSPSIGVAVYPEDGADILVLMKNADAAMYHAKQAGRGTYQFFDSAMNAAAHEQLRLENGLRLALERGQLQMYYQPKVDLKQKRVVGCEALMRWKHPEWGDVSPASFIPIAEECGLIIAIGEWAMRTACRQILELQRSTGQPLTVAVNVSALQFNQRNFVDIVHRVLAETGLAPEYLELELTESALMKDAANVIETLEKLSAMGVKLSVDDFGTGYSSLSYLKRFPLNCLKIDQNFVRDLEKAGDDAAIVNAVISLAHSLRLTVVGEGVETQGQMQFLSDRGCEEAQGYYFDRPLPVDEFEKVLLNPPLPKTA